MMAVSEKSLLYVALGLLVCLLIGQYMLIGLGFGSGAERHSLSNEERTMHRSDRRHQKDNMYAETLKEHVRVLCWIMTSPTNLDQRAVHVRNTWGGRCNKLIFVSSVTNTKFPTIGFNTPEGRNYLTEKTIHAFRYIYENYMDEADWFMKADDDTYVIVENLRHFLSSEDSNAPVYFGKLMKRDSEPTFFSGGAGYVLSKEALRRFGQRGHDAKLCVQTGGVEDFHLAMCMKTLGVREGISTDNMGRSLFHCFAPEDHLHGEYPAWYHDYNTHTTEKGIESISNYAISFHYVTPRMMYNLEFYIYHLRVFGIRPSPPV